MKIVKHGNRNHNSKDVVYRFVCKRCGCVFEAESHERLHFGKRAIASCPECKSWTSEHTEVTE